PWAVEARPKIRRSRAPPQFPLPAPAVPWRSGRCFESWDNPARSDLAFGVQKKDAGSSNGFIGAQTFQHLHKTAGGPTRGYAAQLEASIAFAHEDVRGRSGIDDGFGGDGQSLRRTNFENHRYIHAGQQSPRGICRFQADQGGKAAVTRASCIELRYGC